MHLGFAGANGAAIEVELHIRVIGEERHRTGRIRHLFGNHQRCQAEAEGIIVRAGMPDRNLFGLPGLRSATSARSDLLIIHEPPICVAGNLPELINC